MEKETFGVELELITSKFSQKMESIKSKITNFGKLAKQNFQTGMYMDVGKTKSDLENLKNELKTLTASNYEWTPLGDGYIDSKDKIKKINEIKNEINSLENDIKTFDTSKISKLGQVFGAIKAPIDRVKNSIQQNKKGMDSFSANIKKSFNSGIASVKRFALSLVGIHSIWRGVSRASSAYLSQDIELSNKLQSVWVGLGAMLSPILNNLANVFIKLVGYLNVFLKALTGIDLLGKAMEKANKNTKNTSKSVKTLKGQLSGFDEINNIADNSSGDTADNSNIGWTDAFNNVQLDTSWTEIMTNFGIWMKDNWPIVIGLISGTAIALGLVKLGVGGILSLGIGAILGGIVITISSILAFIKDPSWENFANILIGLSVILAGVAIAMLAVNAANPIAWIVLAIAAVVAFAAVIIKNWDSIYGTLKKGWEAVLGFFKSLWNGIVSIFSTIGKWFSDRFTDAWNSIKKAFSLVGTFFKNIWNTIKSIFTSIGTTIGNAISGAFKTVVNKIIGFAENTINGFIKAINGAIGLINKIPGVEIKKLSLLNIPKLATGTNYVPNDQLAYIHKGEAVVPKKFNSDEFFDRGNDETNSLLRTLIETIENKDSNTYLDGKLIGKTAQSYIINQRRIMGRSVI